MKKTEIFNTLVSAAGMCEATGICFDGIAFAGDKHSKEDMERAKKALPTEREREAMMAAIQVTLLAASSLAIDKHKDGDPHVLLSACIGAAIENVIEHRMDGFGCEAVQR